MMRKTLIFILFLTILYACREEEIQLAQQVEVANERIRFSSVQKLDDFLNEGKEKGYESFLNSIRRFEKGQFKSLMPVFTSSDEDKISEYKEYKLNRGNSQIEKFQKDQLVNFKEFDLEEDELIADPFFASVLNRDYEIQVEDKIYKYTKFGLYFANKSAYADLLDAVDNVQRHIGLPKGEIHTLENDVNYYAPMKMLPVDDYETGGGFGGGYPPTPTISKEEVRRNLKICYWDPNIWDNIFGPAEGCLDYFNSDRRVKTKVWNQNYLIYSSVGIKVKTQNRFAGIWWAEKSDEIELGYTSVYFEYDLPTPVWPKSYVYQYEYNGFIIDQWGRYVGSATGGPKSIFAKFPIEDTDKRILTIYLFEPLETIIGQSSLDFTAKEVNKAIESLAKSAYKALSNYLKKEINGPAVLVFPSKDERKLKFLYTNWIKTKTRENNIVETFDWNSAVIGFSTKGPSINPTYSVPKSYKKFQAIAHGMARRGTVWRGSRVVLNDNK